MPYNSAMKKILLMALLLLPTAAVAQDTAQVRRMFEAGQYQQVIETAAAADAPEAIYTAAQSHQRLGAINEARETYARLVGRPEDDPWHFIGLSGQQLLDDDAEGALGSAQQAVAMAGGLAEAQFQLGLVLARRQDWAGAAEALDRAAELSPAYAYAHYYGGLMHYRANRPDRMAIHFEAFLKLAPEAPERPEVVQIMRTVRGR
jgi:tetratricopeptide (TPR) repeat protein